MLLFRLKTPADEDQDRRGGEDERAESEREELHSEAGEEQHLGEGHESDGGKDVDPFRDHARRVDGGHRGHQSAHPNQGDSLENPLHRDDALVVGSQLTESSNDRLGGKEMGQPQRNGEIVLEVRDNGRGMLKSQLEDLFDPTFRFDSGRVSTTNWGLFICRSIVIEHGGYIEIESKEGVGTTARVLLPASM